MKSENIFEAFGAVDDALIEQALPKEKSRAPRWLAPAAAACLLGAIAVSVMAANGVFGSRGKDTDAMDQPAHTAEAVIETANPTAKPTSKPREETSAPEMDVEWIPFFVHDGCMYQGYQLLPYTAGCIGEYLGDSVFAAEYNKAIKDYAELTGSASGPVYTVKGVDPEIMLCMREQNGAIHLYVNGDKHDFADGGALYEGLLHISECTAGVKYIPYEAFLGSREEYYLLRPGHEAQAEEFIALLNEGEFTSVAYDAELAGQKADGILFTREDGFVIHLIAYKNGLIRLMDHDNGVTHYAVKVDPEKLAAFLELLHEESDPCEGPYAQPETLEDCAADERFGSVIPSEVPEGFTLVYASICRNIDPKTGAILGTERIEFEHKDAGGRYLCASITPLNGVSVADQGVIGRSEGRCYTALVRGDIYIRLDGNFGVPDELFREYMACFGE